MGDGHDALAAYADGSIRFLHHEGGVFAIDSARYDLVMGTTALLGVGQQVADQLIAGGIKGIWNFTPIRLATPSGVIVRSEDLAVGLAELSLGIKNLIGGAR